MQGFIFAAGKGTRLGEMSLTVPKALAEVGGKPMLLRVLEKVADAGATEAVVNVHWLAEKVVDWLDRTELSLPIKVQDESDLLLDTGGSIKRARQDGHIGEIDLLVHNCDVLTRGLNLCKILAYHKANNADATLLCSTRQSSRHLTFGTKEYAFNGIHILSPKAIDTIADVDDKVFSITDFYRRYSNRLNIIPYLPAEPYDWIDVGRPESLEKARALCT